MTRGVLAVSLACILAGIGPPGSAPGEAAQGALLPVEAAAFELSAATGGDFYFWSRGEFARSSLALPLGGEDLLLAHGELSGERLFEVHVDTLLGRLELFVGAQELAEVLVQQPDGSFLSGAPGVRLQAFEHMRLATVEQPRSGPWRIRVRGRGLACVTVRGGSRASGLDPALAPILLVDFGWVERGGRPGHEGWFPLEREPRAGEELMARVSLAGSLASAELGFAGADGRLLGPWTPLALAPGEQSAWVPCVVPAEPYRAVVRGLDVSGAPWQRTHAPRFGPGAPR